MIISDVYFVTKPNKTTRSAVQSPMWDRPAPQVPLLPVSH